MRAALILASLISIGCLGAGEAGAAALTVSPVVVGLTPGQTTATITVENHGGAPTAVQARAYRWTQAEDNDVLVPTQDIVVSPPIFTVPQDGSQTLRLLLRGGARGGEQRFYRLLLDEVPPAGGPRKQIVVVLRLSLPVFVAPPGVAGAPASAAPTLEWRAEPGPGGQIALTATNPGHASARVNAIDVTLPDGGHPKAVARGQNPYVLPGARRHWIVQSGGGAPAGPLHVRVTTDAGKTEYTLVP